MARCLIIVGISSVTAMAFSTVRISRSVPITSTMASGDRTLERVKVTATITMKTFTWVNGSKIRGMARERSSLESKTGTRALGRMTCEMERVF